MQKIRSVFLILVSFFLGILTLSGCENAIINPSQLSDQVLQIIRDNPQVVIKSVQAYQQQQENQIRQNQQAFLQQMVIEPASVIKNSPVIGAENSKIVLVEFSDFQCPFCAEADSLVREFMKQHQDQVTFTYKHFPLASIHAQAQLAAQAAWAAQQQEKFWDYHDELFKNQDQLGEKLYLKLAKDLDLDLEKFENDRNSSEAKLAINQDLELAEKLGLNGTPFFAFHGQPISLPLTLEKLDKILAQVQ